MLILQIEHSVPDFDNWKKHFDSDPLNRKASGVSAFRILKSIDNPDYIIIELDFQDLKEAKAMHAALKQMWTKVGNKVVMNPQSRIIEMVESVELASQGV
jgi:hypothetical protein